MQQDIDPDPLHGQYSNNHVGNASGDYQEQESDAPEDEDDFYVRYDEQDEQDQQDQQDEQDEQGQQGPQDEEDEEDEEDEAPESRSYRGREVPNQAS